MLFQPNSTNDTTEHLCKSSRPSCDLCCSRHGLRYLWHPTGFNKVNPSTLPHTRCGQGCMRWLNWILAVAHKDLWPDSVEATWWSAFSYLLDVMSVQVSSTYNHARKHKSKTQTHAPVPSPWLLPHPHNLLHILDTEGHTVNHLYLITGQNSWLSPPQTKLHFIINLLKSYWCGLHFRNIQV